LQKTPYYTTISGAIAAADGISAVASGELEVRALQDYLA
jgi:carbamoyl-phosphate synthase large subunit